MSSLEPLSSPLHIVMTIDSLMGGGAEKSVLTLAKQMKDLGHHVHMIIFDNTIEYDTSGAPEIVCIPFEKQKKDRIDYQSTANKVEKQLAEWESKNGRIDMVFSNLTNSDRVMTLIKRDNLFFIIRNNIAARDLHHKGCLSRLNRKLKLKKIYHKRNVIAVSQGVMDSLIYELSVSPKTQYVIYNGFEIEEIRLMASDDAEVDLDNFILHVGSFKQQKRHDRVIAAYAKSGVEKPLVLMGRHGKRAEQVKALVAEKGLQDKVIFKSFTQNPYAWMKKASMTVLGSDYEGFARVLIESLIVGTPMVAVDCPSGPSEVLVGELSICLSDMSVDGLAQAMREVDLHPPAIKDEYFSDFSVEKITERYIELIRQYQS